jgi:hypothetical protein
MPARRNAPPESIMMQHLLGWPILRAHQAGVLSCNMDLTELIQQPRHVFEMLHGGELQYEGPM